jgi:hypothetical protein
MMYIALTAVSAILSFGLFKVIFSQNGVLLAA